MKGVIFDLLRTIVETDHGEDAWDDAIDRAGVDGVYTAVGKYPDAESTTLLNHVPSRQAASTADLLRWFGRRAMPELAIAYPMFFRGHESLTTFLPALNDIIHPEVRKLYPDADVPDFLMTGDDEQTLLLEYRSPRRLCALAEGFIVGAADISTSMSSSSSRRAWHGATSTAHWCAGSRSPRRMDEVDRLRRRLNRERRARRATELIAEQSTRDALHDPLTGLANRSLLISRLTDALRRHGTGGEVVVAYVDLDRFKYSTTRTVTSSAMASSSRSPSACGMRYARPTPSAGSVATNSRCMASRSSHCRPATWCRSRRCAAGRAQPTGPSHRRSSSPSPSVPA